VRALAPDPCGRIPAVALTAFARSEDRQRALMAGYQLHVAKPVEPSELLTVCASPAFATGAVDSPPRLINTRAVSKGLHYKRVWDDRGSSERRDVILGGL